MHSPDNTDDANQPRRRRASEFVLDPLRRAADEQQDSLADDRGRYADWRTLVVLIVSAMMLTLRYDEYRYSFNNVRAHLETLGETYPATCGALVDTITADENLQLTRLSYWSLWQLLTYVIIPVLVIKLVLRQRLRDYGVKLRGITKNWWAYLAMYLLILPCVLLASGRQAFQDTYPFYDPAWVLTNGSEPLRPVLDASYWPRFWIWQFFYALQFVSLEFFFRGFMVHGTRQRLGIYSVFVMTIPYCMIHFGKPLPETLGAIVAGVVLGFMSLKTRSIWLGAASHIAVAVTMDLSSLARQM